ncbi:hexokinase-domain-containing protein [Chytriomyces sp. MP71]|nr:hexokinase-domain-containing protein [Chytriomyces sp. MP71]
MLPTHVTKRPTGAETGSYLALDLGGTNFRVCEVTLDGTGGTTMVQSKFVIADDAKTGHGDALFDFIARCVFDFLKEHHGDEAEWVHVGKKLGFTFSFPVDQVSINEGSLLLWTKGFTATGVVGHDVVRLLQDAFKRLGLNIDVIALVNDTTGTLVSLAYTVPNTYIGCILGTGSNCAYVEEIRNVVKYKGASKGLSEMLINMEWGGFDDAQDVIPRTKYDLELDRATPTPGSWTFEQLISGMYLGEIVRLVLVDLVEAGFLFRENEGGSLELRARNAFDTAYMSRIESDNSKDLQDTKIILKDVFHIPQTTLTDRRIVRKVCKIVGLRSARLAGAGISAIATKMNRFHIVVGVDGSLFELYPHYGERMKDAIREVLGVERGNSVVLKQATDGSGIGAALIAALAGE